MPVSSARSASDKFGDDDPRAAQRRGVTQLHQAAGARAFDAGGGLRRWQGQPALCMFYREADRAFTREGLIAALPKRSSCSRSAASAPSKPMTSLSGSTSPPRPQGAARRSPPTPTSGPSLIADMDAYRARAFVPSLVPASIIKMSEEDLDDPRQASRPRRRSTPPICLARPNSRLVVVTLGAEGSLAFTPQGECPLADLSGQAGRRQCRGRGYADGGHPHLARAITNRSRPPDSKLSDEAALKQMLWFGAVAAGINCSRVGANPPTRAEVDAVLARLIPARPKKSSGCRAACSLCFIRALSGRRRAGCGARLSWLVVLVVVIGGGIGLYMLTPVQGPARDLTLVGDVTRGAYLIRLGGCVTCHTDPADQGRNSPGHRAPGCRRRSAPSIRSTSPRPKEHGIGSWTLAQFSEGA